MNASFSSEPGVRSFGTSTGLIELMLLGMNVDSPQLTTWLPTRTAGIHAAQVEATVDVRVEQHDIAPNGVMRLRPQLVLPGARVVVVPAAARRTGPSSGI